MRGNDSSSSRTKISVLHLNGDLTKSKYSIYITNFEIFFFGDREKRDSMPSNRIIRSFHLSFLVQRINSISCTNYLIDWANQQEEKNLSSIDQQLDSAIIKNKHIKNQYFLLETM